MAAGTDSYATLRYREDGQDPATGLSCWGFVRHVFRGRGREIPEDVLEAAELFEPVKPPYREGDLVTFRTARGPHVGVVIEDHGLRLLLHMTAQGVLSSPLRSERLKIEGVYRPCRA